MESAPQKYAKQEQTMVSWHLSFQPYENFHELTFEAKWNRKS